MSLVKVKDTISKDLRKRAAAAGNKRPLLLAMGTAFLSVGKQAFTDPAKRPATWAPRQDDKPHPLLMESGTLETSLTVRVDGSKAIVSSDRPYAAIHQLGGEHIPARPYLPFYANGRITDLGRTRVENALKAALRKNGL